MLATHINLLLDGRGYDRNNLTAYDLNKLSAQLKSATCSRIANEMYNNADFHLFIRRKLNKLIPLRNFFGTLKREKINPLAMRTVLLGLIFRKRREFVKALNSAKQIKFVPAQITAEQARNFVMGKSYGSSYHNLHDLATYHPMDGSMCCSHS